MKQNCFRKNLNPHIFFKKTILPYFLLEIWEKQSWNFWKNVKVKSKLKLCSVFDSSSTYNEKIGENTQVFYFFVTDKCCIWVRTFNICWNKHVFLTYIKKLGNKIHRIRELECSVSGKVSLEITPLVPHITPNSITFIF